MKGFLQRALESARGTEQRLKPLTGSVFSSNHRRQESQLPSWDEQTTIVPAAKTQSPQMIHSEPSQVAGIPTPGQPRPAKSDSTSGDASPNRSVQPLLPTTARAALVHENPETTARVDSRQDLSEKLIPRHTAESLRSDSTIAGPIRSEDARAKSGAESPVPERHSSYEKMPQATPLSQASSKISEREPLLQAKSPARAETAAPQRPIHSRRSSEEPDIQVHIGRIEVIAATPQTPRASAPRPSHSTSLADYLAGRNGRS